MFLVRERTIPTEPIPIKRDLKSVHQPSCVTFLTLTLTRCYYDLPLHRSTTIAVQMAATVPEIMDVEKKRIFVKEESNCNII
jgi:hypothetical protein